MNCLEARIAKDGVVKEGNVLKVDSFLNHQMDIALMDEIGKEFYKRFQGKSINKILTIEASGIAIAYAVAQQFQVPLLFAKKSKSINIAGDTYVAEVVRIGISLQLLILVPIMRELVTGLMPVVVTIMVVAQRVRQTMILMPNTAPRNVWRIRRLPLILMRRYA